MELLYRPCYAKEETEHGSDLRDGTVVVAHTRKSPTVLNLFLKNYKKTMAKQQNIQLLKSIEHW